MFKYSVIYLIVTLAMIMDIQTRKIPNAITFSGIIFGLSYNAYLGGIVGIKNSILGVVIPIFLLFIFFSLRMLGAGDIKLFSAIGAIAGSLVVLKVIALSILAGGFIAIGVMLSRNNARVRIKYLKEYCRACFISCKLQQYQVFEDSNDGLFRFSYAIAAGVILVQLLW